MTERRREKTGIGVVDAAGIRVADESGVGVVDEAGIRVADESGIGVVDEAGIRVADESGVGVVGDDGRMRLGCTSSTSNEILAGRDVRLGEDKCGISTSCVAQGVKRSSFAVR